MTDQEVSEQEEAPQKAMAAVSDDAEDAEERQERQPEINAQQVDSPSSIDKEVEQQMMKDLTRMEAGEGKDGAGLGTDREADLSISNIIGEENLVGPDEPLPTVKKVQFGGLDRQPAGGQNRNIDILMEVKLPISIELGRTQMSVRDILDLGPGSVVELDKLAGEPVELLVNSKVIAKGEVVVVDENFGIRVTNLLSPEERIKSL
jgi:flagellar motor switch protein FliN